MRAQTANKSLEEIDLLFLPEEEKAHMELNLAHSDPSTIHGGRKKGEIEPKHAEHA